MTTSITELFRQDAYLLPALERMAFEDVMQLRLLSADTLPLLHDRLCDLIMSRHKQEIISLAEIMLSIDVMTERGQLVRKNDPLLKHYLCNYFIQLNTSSESDAAKLQFNTHAIHNLRSGILPFVMNELDIQDLLLDKEGNAFTLNIVTLDDEILNSSTRKHLLVDGEKGGDANEGGALVLRTLRLCHLESKFGVPQTEGRQVVYEYQLTQKDVCETVVQHGGYGGHWDHSQGEILDIVFGLQQVPFLQREHAWLLTYMMRLNKFCSTMLDTIDRDIDDQRIGNKDGFKKLCVARLKKLAETLQ